VSHVRLAPAGDKTSFERQLSPRGTCPRYGSYAPAVCTKFTGSREHWRLTKTRPSELTKRRSNVARNLKNVG